jgi:ABC-type dipeptide/oligopeptide/nickel transport system permease component
MREGSFTDRTISLASTIATSIPEFATGASWRRFVVWLAILPHGVDGFQRQLVDRLATHFVYYNATTFYLGYLVRMVRAHEHDLVLYPHRRAEGNTFPRWW